jgi:small subunit ribosomal protein S20
MRQSVQRRLRNRVRTGALKAQIRRFKEAVSGGNAAAAEKEYRKTCKLLDRTADLGTIHKNTASRRKSRLSRMLNAATKGKK